MIFAQDFSNALRAAIIGGTIAFNPLTSGLAMAQVSDPAQEDTSPTGDAGVDEAIDQLENAVKKKARAEATKKAIEKYGSETIKKYAKKVPSLAGKSNPVTIGLSVMFASSPAGEGSDIVPTREELEMMGVLAKQTTGLSSPIGSALPSPDPKLERALAIELNSPFTTSVETPDTKSSGAFAGTEGLNVAGMLRVFAYDSGRLQDGDRVRLTVTDSRGVRLTRSFTLTFGGKTSTVSARRGLVKVKITALNVGSSPPNTGGLRVSGDVAGNRSGNFDLSKGQSGTLVVRVVGN